MYGLPDNYDLHIEQKAFHDRLLKCIRIFIKWSQRNSYCMSVFEKSLNLLNLSAYRENAALFRVGSLAKKFRIKESRPIYLKQLCLLYTLYRILELHRDYKAQKVSAIRLNHCVNYLENIIEKGLDPLKVRGSIKAGWRLKGTNDG